MEKLDYNDNEYLNAAWEIEGTYTDMHQFNTDDSKLRQKLFKIPFVYEKMLDDPKSDFNSINSFVGPIVEAHSGMESNEDYELAMMASATMVDLLTKKVTNKRYAETLTPSLDGDMKTLDAWKLIHKKDEIRQQIKSYASKGKERLVESLKADLEDLEEEITELFEKSEELFTEAKATRQI